MYSRPARSTMIEGPQAAAAATRCAATVGVLAGSSSPRRVTTAWRPASRTFSSALNMDPLPDLAARHVSRRPAARVRGGDNCHATPPRQSLTGPAAAMAAAPGSGRPLAAPRRLAEGGPAPLPHAASQGYCLRYEHPSWRPVGSAASPAG